MGKTLTWQRFGIGLVINIIIITVLVIIGNRVFTPQAERFCHQQIGFIQSGINAYNQSHPNDKILQMEFGFPGFIEQTLIPQGYIKQQIPDLRENHSYYLERNGFVNCRIHQRNPISIMILGIAILSGIVTIVTFALFGYQLKYRES
ncbi:MAG: hypothetical protein ACE14V_08250 [bacterium]